MKKHLLIGSSLIALLSIMNTGTVNSKQGNPPAGNAGDPVTNSSCVSGGCHGGQVGAANANNLTLTIGTGTPTDPLDNSFVYTPGQQYNIGFLINAFTGRYGFQIVALNSSNTQAGTMTVSNAATTKINSSGGRQYMGHLNASSTKNWTFKWTAPAAGTGLVTFYYAFATEDTDGNPGSNVIYKGNVSIEPLLSSVENISDKLEALNIYPNPVENELGISFNMLKAENLKAELYSIDGQVSKGLMNEELSAGIFSRTFNVNELPTGIYLLKLQTGNATVTKKIFKQ